MKAFSLILDVGSVNFLAVNFLSITAKSICCRISFLCGRFMCRSFSDFRLCDLPIYISWWMFSNVLMLFNVLTVFFILPQSLVAMHAIANTSDYCQHVLCLEKWITLLFLTAFTILLFSYLFALNYSSEMFTSHHLDNCMFFSLQVESSVFYQEWKYNVHVVFQLIYHINSI